MRDDTTDNDVVRKPLPITEHEAEEFTRKAVGIISPNDSETCNSDISEVIDAFKAARGSIPGQEREAARKFVKLAEKYFDDLDKVRRRLLTRVSHPFPAPAEYRALVPDAPPYFTDDQLKLLMHTYRYFPLVVERGADDTNFGVVRRGEAPEKELAVVNALWLMDRHSCDMPRLDPDRVSLVDDAAYFRFRDLAYLLFFGHVPAADDESGNLPIMREDGFSQYCREARRDRNAAFQKASVK